MRSKKIVGRVETGPEAGEGAEPLLETHEVKTPSARAQLALIMRNSSDDKSFVINAVKHNHSEIQYPATSVMTQIVRM